MDENNQTELRTSYTFHSCHRKKKEILNQRLTTNSTVRATSVNDTPNTSCYHIDFTRRIKKHQRKRITPRKVARVFNKGKASRFTQAGFFEAMSLPIENGEDSEEVIFEERTEELFFPVEDEEVFE